MEGWGRAHISCSYYTLSFSPNPSPFSVVPPTQGGFVSQRDFALFSAVSPLIDCVDIICGSQGKARKVPRAEMIDVMENHFALPAQDLERHMARAAQEALMPKHLSTCPGRLFYWHTICKYVAFVHIFSKFLI